MSQQITPVMERWQADVKGMPTPGEMKVSAALIDETFVSRTAAAQWFAGVGAELLPYERLGMLVVLKRG